MLYTLFYNHINPYTNFGKVLFDLMIGKANDLNSVLLKKTAAFTVICLSLLGKVLRPIDFNNKMRSGTVEVGDKAP